MKEELLKRVVFVILILVIILSIVGTYRVIKIEVNSVEENSAGAAISNAPIETIGSGKVRVNVLPAEGEPNE